MFVTLLIDPGSAVASCCILFHFFTMKWGNTDGFYIHLSVRLGQPCSCPGQCPLQVAQLNLPTEQPDPALFFPERGLLLLLACGRGVPLLWSISAQADYRVGLIKIWLWSDGGSRIRVITSIFIF